MVFSFMGPPPVSPYWFCLNGFLPVLFALAKKSCAFSTVLRKYWYALPWNLLVRDLDQKLITPPEYRSYSELLALVWTRNSATASGLGTRFTKLPNTELAGTPS